MISFGLLLPEVRDKLASGTKKTTRLVPPLILRQERQWHATCGLGYVRVGESKGRRAVLPTFIKGSPESSYLTFPHRQLPDEALEE